MSAACAKYDDVTSINKVAEVQAKVNFSSPYFVSTGKITRSVVTRSYVQVDDVKMTMESNVKVLMALPSTV